MKHRCTVGAHRGASTAHMENTLNALKAADENKRYAFIEFDVQYTRDNAIVVFHDKRLLRLFGSLRAIGRTDVAELRRMTDGDICLYSEAMEVLHKKINIEIKSQGDTDEDARLADEVIADIKVRGREQDVLISSISRDVIGYIGRRHPEIRTGLISWLTSSAYMPLEGLTESLYREMDDLRASYLLLHIANLRNIENLLRLKPEGKTVIFWDFDDAMYLVHKDLSDRVWGDSGFTEFFRFIQYGMVRPFRNPHKNRQGGK